MTESSDAHAKKSGLKGRRLGGTRFPRQPLGDALVWSKKLVAKTHLGPQVETIILSGVVGSSGTTGQIRLSTLKQFGLLSGDSKGYVASDLAKRIDAAPDEEKIALLRAAALKPPVFKTLFDTFHGDEVSTGKLKQLVSELKVHPDHAANCVNIYIKSLEFAGLLTADGDKALHSSAIKVENAEGNLDASESNRSDDVEEFAENDEEVAEELAGSMSGRRAVFNVNVTLDSSLDTEKLERQLKLLKKFGAI